MHILAGCKRSAELPVYCSESRGGQIQQTAQSHKGMMISVTTKHNIMHAFYYVTWNTVGFITRYSEGHQRLGCDV